jgi:HEAT repeat protein
VLGQSKNKAYEQKFIKFLDLTLSQNLVVKATELYIRVNILNEFLNKLTEDDKYKKYIADKSSAENDIKMIEEFIINLKDKKYIKLKDRAFIALERTKLFDSMVTDVLEGEKKSELKERAEKALSVIGDIEDLINEYIKENEKQEEMMLLSSIVLGGIKSKKAVQELIRIFENTENNWLKKEIVIALGNIGDEKAENTLINNFGKSVDREVDEEIVVSLGRIKGRKSIKVLLKSVKTYPDKWVRIKAVESLNGIKVDSVIDELWADFEKESDVDVKNAIINYMKNSGSNKTPDRLKSVILDTREENEARLNAARSFLASKYVNRKEKNLLKGEMISTLTGASSDNEKIFVLDTVRELVIIEALEAVCQLKKSKNPQIRERAVKTAVVLTATYKQ